MIEITFALRHPAFPHHSLFRSALLSPCKCRQVFIIKCWLQDSIVECWMVRTRSVCVGKRVGSV